MKTQLISILTLVVDVIMAILLVVCLILDWVKPTSTTPEGYSVIKINDYKQKSLYHTCKTDSTGFNEGCLTYQGSVVVIIMCSTSLFTIAVNTFMSGIRCIAGDLIEKKEGRKKTNTYIITISTVHILLFAQLFIAVIAYLTGSHRIRHDLDYKYGPGWIILLIVMIISLAFSLVLFFIQCLISKLKSIITLFTQIVMFLLPTGTVFILIGLCTSFFTSLDFRLNALKLKEMSNAVRSSTNLKDYCDFDFSAHTIDSSDSYNTTIIGPEVADHLCSLYKSSAALIAFSVLGFLSSFVISARLLDSLKKIVFIVLTFVFFFIGFLQYSIVSLDVMDDFDFHYGLGWVFYLVGFILTSVGLLLNAIDIVLFGRGKNKKVRNTDIEELDSNDNDDEGEDNGEGENNDDNEEGNKEKKHKKHEKKKVEEEEVEEGNNNDDNDDNDEKEDEKEEEEGGNDNDDGGDDGGGDDDGGDDDD